MATLVAIGFTVSVGVAVFTVSMVWFGIAMKRRNNFIATRCVARPSNVIYNPNPTKDYDIQDRGNAFWGWIPWVMNLTYATILGGVPGTGTRDGGLSGMMLKVNLDGIVLLRFHHLCFRVCSLAAFLYLVIVLPVYRTAQCSRIHGDYGSLLCEAQNLTDYQRLTLANVPPMVYNSTSDQSRMSQSFFLPVNDCVLARLYVVVFVTWIVTMYAFRQLDEEWRDILALRRVYFLEADHHHDRTLELEETLLRDEREKEGEEDDDGHDDDDDDTFHFDESMRMKPTHISHDSHDEEPEKSSYRSVRDPWVPHPEQRDTVPNIELYSVLVGGLPNLPTEAFVQEEIEAMFSRKQAIDWQLSVTTAFFDHCVPNQPGYSSSVAAVTILPAASQITEAWNHWYKAAAKLRKLRFIRRQIAKIRERQGENATAIDPGGDDADDRNGFSSDDEEFGEEYAIDLNIETTVRTTLRPKRAKKRKRLKFKRKKKKKKKKKQVSVYSMSDQKKKYYQDVLGMENDLDVETNLLHALNLGPEQTAVYSREFAQGAANLAPYGWNEGKVRNASLSELIEMEKKAILNVEAANSSLREAQGRIAESSDGGDNLSENDLEKMMKRASSMGSDDFSDIGIDDIDIDDIESQTPNPLERGSSERKISLENTVDTDEDSDNMCHQQRANNQQQRKSSMSMLGSDVVNVVDSGIRGTLGAMDAVGKSILQLADPVSAQRRMSNGGVAQRRMSNGGRAQRRGSNGGEIPKGSGHGISLEASLFLKQKQKNDRNHSQSSSKGSTPRRSKSSNDIPRRSFDQEQNPHAVEKEKAGRQKRTEHHRSSLRNGRSAVKSKSYDNIDIMIGVTEEEEDTGVNIVNDRPVQVTPILRKPTRGLVPSPLVEGSSSSAFVESTHQCDAIDPVNISNVEIHHTEERKELSIWEKIANETARRSSLRQRLSNVKTRSLSSAHDESKKGVQFSSAPDPPFLTPTNSRNVNFSSDTILNRGRTDTHDSTGNENIFSIREGGDDDESRAPSDFEKDMATAENHLDQSQSVRSHSSAADNIRLAFDFEEKAGLRNRHGTASTDRLSKINDEKWSKVVQIVTETARNPVPADGQEVISSGRWTLDGGLLRSLLKSFCHIISQIFRPFQMGLQSTKLVDHLASENSYAVVTFTSRQAAVAARHVLADSRGSDRWVTISDIPSPPLADAPVCNSTGFRGCVRPVTISINDKQKLLRRTIAYALLVTIYFFYTFPLTRAQQLVSPESLARVIPYLDRWLENPLLDYMFSGFIPALVWVAFFAICPPMFKAIANFGSNATSSAKAENSALKYFWWFMVLSAFTGTSLETAVINGFSSGVRIGQELQAVIVTTAQTIPTEVSATWLNWMIVRVSIVLPTQYLLQLNSFLFTSLGLKCCARAVRGGGSGGPVPYRLYVDSGVVMLCMFALAPASPLISAASFFYFLFCLPMLRWTMIFQYRPRFDLGGKRFPFIFDMIVSGIIVGELLLVTMMTLRGAFGPALAAFVPIPFTIAYRWMLRRRYLRAFSDVALLQTSLLDGLDPSQESCLAKREEQRQWLVDAHKAAYVPVCIASSKEAMITSEPAAVLPLETDVEDFDDMTSVNESVFCGSTVGGGSTHGGGGSIFGSNSVNAAIKHHNHLLHPYQPDHQHGVMMRRASAVGLRSPHPQTKMMHDSIMMTHIDVSGSVGNAGFPSSPTASPLRSPTVKPLNRNRFVSPKGRRATQNHLVRSPPGGARNDSSAGKLPAIPNMYQ
eukprot:CAMPEP_0113497048 /NCGR_PEP_ID=MMETSP0014_2-20120614/30432_1 /TAXON_ID=2857 /ORGANISM="Nitzschia sp." /LENGTH=1750 /DNA_ID=CAMNT_0000390981 /DNA_START=222 /DNA_END=5474 /DNA_ORIENTATION=+ /assembly_acc=CAM_ASM_000159